MTTCTPGNLIKITNKLSNDALTFVPVMLTPNTNYVYFSDVISLGTLAVIISLTEIETVKFEDLFNTNIIKNNNKASFAEILYYYNGFTKKGWVYQENIEKL